MILPLSMGPLKKKAVATDRSSISADLYIIDIKKWGIYDDGTHPAETEKGINDAIVWAKDNGYAGVYLKAGTYLIEPTYYADPVNKTGGIGVGLPYPASLRMGGERGIQPTNNSILMMHKDCIIKTNPNNAHVSVSISICDKENVTIIGGQVIGDKDAHIFTFYPGYGIGGNNHGLVIQRSNNIKIMHTIFLNHGGDGVLIIDTMDAYRMSNNICMKDVVCNNNMRQGMSIVGGDNMVFEDCTFSESNGQSPEYGVAIESGSYSATNIIFRRCKFIKNNRGGFINADGINPILENCIFSQGLGYHPAYGIELKDCTFNNQDFIDYYKKYPYLLTVDTTYVVGDRARLDLATTSEGYVCSVAGTTSGTMTRKNNWPPAGIQSSLLGIVYTYGTTEWVHEDNYYSYGGPGGITPSSQPYLPSLPVTARANSTAYNVGNQVRLSDGTSVVCTVAGTSGTSAPSTSGKYISDTLTDGGVTWNIVDNVMPSKYRRNSTAYAEGDIVWWGDETYWECVTAGTTGAAEPTLKDLPIGTILIAHASSSRIQKVVWDATAPDWEPKVTKDLNDKVNIAGTTWQYVSKTPYSITFGDYSAGDREPRVTDLANDLTLTDGTVVWKKGNRGINLPITKTVVERCVLNDVVLTLTGPTVFSNNNRVINNEYKVTGRQVFSKGNEIINAGKPTKNVIYALNYGKVQLDSIKNSLVAVNVTMDYAKPRKKLIEQLLFYNSIQEVNNNGILYDCSLVLTDPNTAAANLGPTIKMVGGKISAYMAANAILFKPWVRQFILDNVTIDITLSFGSSFMKPYTKAADGYYTTVKNCTFNVTPLDNNVELFAPGYTDGNVKLVNNKFFNTDSSKSIKITLPASDTTNTFNHNNFYDFNCYVTDINSANNIGGYGVRTTMESAGVPVRGTYALGTRVMNIAPAIGTPKSWLVTTAGTAYSAIRANDTAYTAGTFVKWPKGSNIYECIVSGTTASAPPSAGAGTIADGTVTWLYRGNTTAIFTSEGNL